MRLAYSATIHPSPRMPIAATSTASGAAPPAPLLAALMPTSSGTRKAIENTGPMNPIDCATASGSLSLWCVASRSYDEPACCDATEILLSTLGVGGCRQPCPRPTRTFATERMRFNADHTGPNDLGQDLPHECFVVIDRWLDCSGPAIMTC